MKLLLDYIFFFIEEKKKYVQYFEFLTIDYQQTCSLTVNSSH